MPELSPVCLPESVYVCSLSVSLQSEATSRMGREAIFCYLGWMEAGILLCCSLLTILHGRTRTRTKLGLN